MPNQHASQSMAYDYFMFTDKNFLPRFKAMTPRLQAKIPKFFGWQLAPGYDYYLWIDGSLTLSNPDSLKYFYDHGQGYDVVVLKHPTRPDIRQEVRYTRKGINQQSLYIKGRYDNELLKEQYGAIRADKDFIDDILLTGGIFMYKNVPEAHQMLKEWWYHVSRYIINDQISFPYVLKKSGLKINIMPDLYHCSYVTTNDHKYRS